MLSMAACKDLLTCLFRRKFPGPHAHNSSLAPRYLAIHKQSDGKIDVRKVGLTWSHREQYLDPNTRWGTVEVDTFARQCQRDMGQWDNITGRRAIMCQVHLCTCSAH